MAKILSIIGIFKAVLESETIKEIRETISNKTEEITRYIEDNYKEEK